MARDTSAPAFPRPASEYTEDGTLHDGNLAVRAQSGMTLRDYFAAKAMQGFISRGGTLDGDESFDHILAKWSYEAADAMLAERAK